MTDIKVTEQAYALLELTAEIRKGRRCTFSEALNVVIASKQDTVEGAKAYAELYFSTKKKEQDAAYQPDTQGTERHEYEKLAKEFEQMKMEEVYKMEQRLQAEAARPAYYNKINKARY